jgi:hypothetical protein
MLMMPDSLRREATMAEWRNPLQPREFKVEVIALDRVLESLRGGK